MSLRAGAQLGQSLGNEQTARDRTASELMIERLNNLGGMLADLITSAAQTRSRLFGPPPPSEGKAGHPVPVPNGTLAEIAAATDELQHRIETLRGVLDDLARL